MPREKVQRLALVALVVVAVAFVGSRLLHAGRHVAGHVTEHVADSGHHDRATFEAEMAAVEAEMAALEAEIDAEVEGAVGGAISARAAGRDEVLFEQSFPVQPGDRLAVALSSEDLVVETGAGAASVTVLGEGRDAREAFPRRRFSATYGGGTLRVETNPERNGFRLGGERASYTVVVRVPERMAAELRLASGDVRLGDLQGDLHLETASGDASLGRVRDAAAVRVTTASGDVHAALLDGAEVAVQTASGDVQVDRLAARTASVQTASGDVAVGAAGADRFEAHTASGDVAVERLDAGAVVASTASGDVALRLDGAAPVEASTGSGDVGLALPRAGFDVSLSGPAIEIDGALDFQGQRGRRSAEGRLGGGGPRLAVSTGGGEIRLTAR